MAQDLATWITGVVQNVGPFVDGDRTMPCISVIHGHGLLTIATMGYRDIGLAWASICFRTNINVSAKVVNRHYPPPSSTFQKGMLFRARLSPVSLVRYQDALLWRARPSLACPAPTLATGGPGPSTSATFLSRSYNSTQPNRTVADFFRRKNDDSKSNAVALLSQFSKGPIIPTYEAYLDGRLESSDYNGLTAEDFTYIFETLFPMAIPGSLEVIHHMYVNLEALHGVTANATHHRAMVTGLARRGYVGEALKIANTHTKDMDTREWVALVTSAVTASPELLDDVLDIAPVEDQVYAPLLAQENHQHEEDIAATLRTMEQRGLILGPWCKSHLARVYAAVDLPRALEIVREWDPQTLENQELRQLQWGAIAHVHAAAGDTAAVISALRSMDIQDPSATLYLVRQELRQFRDAAGTLHAVDKVQAAIGQDLSPDTWTALVTYVLQSEAIRSQDGELQLNEESIRAAWQVYQNARNRATVVTAQLAETLIKSFTTVDPPQLDIALEVYEDLSRASDADFGNAALMPSKTMYHDLLSSCIAATPPAREAIFMLAKDSDRRDIAIQRTTIVDAMLHLMEKSKDHIHAYEVYTKMRHLTGRFRGAQWRTITTRFIALSFPDSAVAPPEFVMQMVQDMRKAGYPPGSHIVTALLETYAALGKRVRKKRKADPASTSKGFEVSALHLAIRDVYVLVRLDPIISVDIPLLVSLVDAFSSAGAFSEAFDVWGEIIRLLPTISPEKAAVTYSPAINVIIDTCGHADNLARAKRIWAWAIRHELAEDERNWAAWVECLSRLGQFEKALDVVCKEMGTKGIPSASRDTASIVAKFSWRSPSDMGPILNRLQQRFPEWADHFAAIVHTKK